MWNWSLKAWLCSLPSLGAVSVFNVLYGFYFNAFLWSTLKASFSHPRKRLLLSQSKQPWGQIQSMSTWSNFWEEKKKQKKEKKPHQLKVGVDLTSQCLVLVCVGIVCSLSSFSGNVLGPDFQQCCLHSWAPREQTELPLGSGRICSHPLQIWPFIVNSLVLCASLAVPFTGSDLLEMALISSLSLSQKCSWPG